MCTGSVDGATSLLIDEPIAIRDDNYFFCAQEPAAAEPTSTGTVGDNNNTSNSSTNKGDAQQASAESSSHTNNATEEVSFHLVVCFSVSCLCKGFRTQVIFVVFI